MGSGRVPQRDVHWVMCSGRCAMMEGRALGELAAVVEEPEAAPLALTSTAI